MALMVLAALHVSAPESPLNRHLIIPARGEGILLDGSCDDDAWRQAPKIDLGNDTSLQLSSDSRFLYLCVSPPENSLATADLYIADAAGEIHNLHVSAHIGERTKKGGSWPDFIWWNNKGWSSNPVSWIGKWKGRTLDVQWVPSKGREVQIRRDKFPGEKWSVLMELRHIKSMEPRTPALRFPADADPDQVGSWAVLALGQEGSTALLPGS